MFLCGLVGFAFVRLIRFRRVVSTGVFSLNVTINGVVFIGRVGIKW